MTEEEAIGARLGSLLKSCGIVNDEQISQALELASTLSMPLGRALVTLGIVGNNVIAAAVEMQSLLIDELADLPTVMCALRLVKQEGLTPAAALSRSGWTPKEDIVFTKLGELLLDAGVISKDQHEEALSIAAKTGMPLGRVLTINDFVSHAMLLSALNAQVMIRDGRIKRRQAVSGLRAAHERQRTVEYAFMQQGLKFETEARKLKLGEMLVMGGILSEQDLLNCLEIGLLTDKPIGQVLIKSGLLTQEAMDMVLDIQQMVGRGDVPPSAAGELLRQAYLNKKSLSDAVAELNDYDGKKAMLGELFEKSGVVSKEDIDEAIRLTLEHSSLLGKVLVATGHIQEDMLNNGLRCQYFVRKGILTEQDAVLALSYSRRMRCSVDEAITELGLQQGDENS